MTAKHSIAGNCEEDDNTSLLKIVYELNDDDVTLKDDESEERNADDDTKEKGRWWRTCNLNRQNRRTDESKSAANIKELIDNNGENSVFKFNWIVNWRHGILDPNCTNCNNNNKLPLLNLLI